MFSSDFISGSRDFKQHLTSGELILIHSTMRASWFRLRARMQQKNPFEPPLRLPYTSRSFCRRTAVFLSASNLVKICRDISLPHTSRFFVASNRVQAWGQVDLRHVGKDVCSRDSHDNSSLVEVRASPDKLS